MKRCLISRLWNCSQLSPGMQTGKAFMFQPLHLHAAGSWRACGTLRQKREKKTLSPRDEWLVASHSYHQPQNRDPLRQNIHTFYYQLCFHHSHHSLLSSFSDKNTLWRMKKRLQTLSYSKRNSYPFNTITFPSVSMHRSEPAKSWENNITTATQTFRKL